MNDVNLRLIESTFMTEHWCVCQVIVILVVSAVKTEREPVRIVSVMRLESSIDWL